MSSPAPVPPAPEPKGRRRRRKPRPIGLAPGTLLPDPQAPKAQLRVFAFGESGLLDRALPSPFELSAIAAAHTVTWLDVTGIGDVEVLRAVADVFNLHRLAIEDVANPHQRAKVEDYGDHVFVVGRMLSAQNPHETEQLSMFVGSNFVVTFQEEAGDCWGEVRKRLVDPASRLRTHGADYLAYALLDAMVDAYFPVMEQLGDQLEAAEEHVLTAADPRASIGPLHAMRRRLLVLRRALWPLRDACGTLVRGEVPQFSAALRPYLRDVHDHVVQLLDLLENYREMGSSLMELHLSNVSYRLNEVMKVLTMIATIFIPLTFLVGVYGMNLPMPETHYWWSYPVLWTAMLGIAGSMLWYFRKRHWI